MAQGGGQAGGMGGNPMGGQLGGSPMGGQQRMMPPPTPQMGGQLGGMNPMGGQPQNPMGGMGGMGGQLGGMNPMGGQLGGMNPMGGMGGQLGPMRGNIPSYMSTTQQDIMGGMGGQPQNPMGGMNPMGGQLQGLGGMGGDPMDRQMYGVQQFQPRNQQATDIMDMYPTYGGMRGDPMGSRNPMGGQLQGLGGMGPMGGQLNPDFMQQMYGLPQQGMGGFNQNPKTEADWNNFSNIARFAPGTDMEKAKADFLAQGNVRPPFNQQNMQQPQQGMGDPQALQEFQQRLQQRMGALTPTDAELQAVRQNDLQDQAVQEAMARIRQLQGGMGGDPMGGMNPMGGQQPAGIAGLQSLLYGMPNQSTPTAQPAPVAARPAPISVVPPNTPPAVASAIQKLAGRQARRR